LPITRQILASTIASTFMDGRNARQLERSQLADELRALRKGRGLLDAELRGRVGPQLIALCGISDPSDTALVRKRLSETLQNLTAELPPDLRLAAVAAFGLGEEAQHRFYAERIEWLAAQLNVGGRTAQRRVGHALELLVESAVRTGRTTAVGSAEFPGEDWYIDFFRGVLRLDVPTPELHEERTVVAVQDGVGEIEIALTIPPPAERARPPEVEASIIYGGLIKRADAPAAGHHRFVVELPRPLSAGESHHFMLQFRLPDRPADAPHYAVLPLRSFRKAELITRFGSSYVPQVVWRLDHVPPLMIEAQEPVGPELMPDRLGEVRLQYSALRPGHGYGIAWVWPDTDSSGPARTSISSSS